jgi:hypothetical protein
MATVRRLYIYLVCLISLQSVVGALTALLGGAIRWVAGAAAPDALSLTFQLAVIIVGAPIFLGHWIWALALARRDPVELNSLSRRLYLYTTKGIFVGYMAFAVFNGTLALVSLVLPAASNSTLPASELIGNILNSAVTLVITGAPWFYHDRLTASDKLAQDGLSRAIHQFYLLAFSAIGLIAGAIGLTTFQFWIFHRLDGDTSTDLSLAIALVVSGGLLWLYHEWAGAREARLRDSTTDLLRWLSATFFSGAAVVLAFSGLYGIQVWLFHRIAGEPSPALPDALALLVTGLPVLAYYEGAARRVTTNVARPLRWLYGLLFSVLGMISAVAGGVAALQWFFSFVAGLRPDVPDVAAWLLPGLVVWAWLQRDMTKTGLALGLAEETTAGFRGAGRLLRRIYVLSFSAVGAGLAALGLIGVQEWLFTRLGGQGVFRLPDALAWLIAGILLWLYYWRWAGRLFAGNLADERRSDLRKAYLYLIITVAVITAITTIALLVNGALRALLGLPSGGSLGLPLAIIVASAALWAYHAFVLRRDIAAAGESALQAGMQRLYWYLVAALGLAAFVIGIAGELSVAIRLLALRFLADDALKDQFAGFTAAFVAGLPVWLMAWVPAQRTAAQAGPAGTASRRSVLRKAYLYFYLLVAVVITLANAIGVVYQLLNVLFGLFGGGNVLADIAQSTGFTVISSAVWIYHGWVLRGDGRRAKQDKDLEVEKKAKEDEQAVNRMASDWARFPVAVVDGGDGSFGRSALAALKSKLPYLNLIPVGLTPEASAAMGADPAAGAEAQLAAAALIVLPWTVLAADGPIASSPALKILVPVSAPGIQWAGVSPAADQGPEIVRAVGQALKNTLSSQRPAQAIARTNGSQ